MTSEQRFELIARYIMATDDVINARGTEDLELLRLLLRAARDEAVKGKIIAHIEDGVPAPASLEAQRS